MKVQSDDYLLYKSDLDKLGCLKKRRRSRPADWGIGMTVGIAAIADSTKSIIFATDQMMSVGIRTADLPLVVKAFSIHKRWFSLYAGTATLVTLVLAKVKVALASSVAPDVLEVSSVFVRVFQEERRRLAEQAVLSPLGLDMQTFVSLWANNQSAELSDMRRKIQDFDFDCEFLVGGYGPADTAHVFTVTPPGVENNYDPVGFWSIGIGADAALSSLLFRRIHPLMPFKQTIYHVAEAKFMSECVMGVGKNSLFFSLASDGKAEMLSTVDVPKLRQLWEAEGQPPIPSDLDTRVPDFIDMAQFKPPSQGSPSGGQPPEGQP